MTIELPPLWSLGDLLRADHGRAVLWTTGSVAPLVRSHLPWPSVAPEAPIADGVDTLIVVGGGTLIDQAKAAARDARRLQLIAVPSIWGSGAEASPVVVLDRNGVKDIRMDARYLPDRVVIWPELAASVPADRARHACGDSWAHALEGFLSPLASEPLRADLADLMRCMLDLPLAGGPEWFAMSAQASAGQAKSSVGLTHGIAHTLEGGLRRSLPAHGYHHASLCSTYLWPVMEFNRQGSDKWTTLAQQHQLDEAAIFKVLRDLHTPGLYRDALPALVESWRSVLRDQCTRTNSVMVRPGHVAFFESWSPQ